ncbi:Tfp pilus assembly protein FimT/FimU [Moritella sp. F3]|uniref:pilus assembly FimT family protein n=1 Tax=Moritella sp. F3 TaxID=2718882 RepID=UPI0018E13734|nr:type II secretion system protein [Moritella sp. F3]GIC76089.1 MSHA biogenesis protein MshC [Moritella sp. F1]GIC82809.1 MSHA biogenesis protein MshC [Moritella sp. F3]
MHKHFGFTLIELVIVIILTGILAATAIPKLIGNDGFEAQAYRDQLLQLLKTVQQQAMSCDSDCQTSLVGTPSDPLAGNAYACNRVVITAERFGIPTNCGTTLPTTFTAPQLGMSQAEADSSRVQFSAHTIEFDSWGVASGCVGCNISIIGEQTLSISIESQGYIHE